MRLLLALLALASFGCTTTRTVPSIGQELRITTPEASGVVVDDLTGEGSAVVIAGPRVTIALGKGRVVRVADLNGADVSAVLDREKDWVTWEGSFEVEVVRGEEVESRFRVRDATVVLGRFEGNEGWKAED